jgi:agmatinase
MKCVFHHRYMGSAKEEAPAAITLLGCPLDETSSFRGGTRFAPESIRKASWTLETYSPYLKQDLDGVLFYDAGDLELRSGDLEYSLDLIGRAAAETAGKGKKILALGGEHLIAYPLLKAMKQCVEGVCVVHFDAHCDLRDDYEGQRLSHATVMKRVRELGIREILQVGIRSGTRSEFEEAVLVESPAALAARLDSDAPVYISFDMDVFDPSCVPGVTTPEPGGFMFREVIDYFAVLKGRRLIGADIVELSPDYDATFVSSIAAAKVVREMLMLLHG